MNIKRIIKEEMDKSFDWASEIPATEPLTAENAKVGLKVIIRSDSRYYDDGGSNNPKDMFGEIIEANGGNEEYPIRVIWDNDIFNYYQHKDLDVYQ